MQTPTKGRCAGQVTGASQHANGLVEGISYALRPGDLPFSAATSERALSLPCPLEGDPGFAARDRPPGVGFPTAAGPGPTGTMGGDPSNARPLGLAIVWDCCTFSAATIRRWSTAPGEGAPESDANEVTRIHSGKNTNAIASRNAMPAPTILRATARTARSSRSSCACSPASKLAVLKSLSEKCEATESALRAHKIPSGKGPQR